MRDRRGTAFLGAALLAIGCIATASQVGVSVAGLWRWWPVIPVAIALLRLVRPQTATRRSLVLATLVAAAGVAAQVGPLDRWARSTPPTPPSWPEAPVPPPALTQERELRLAVESGSSLELDIAGAAVTVTVSSDREIQAGLTSPSGQREHAFELTSKSAGAQLRYAGVTPGTEIEVRVPSGVGLTGTVRDGSLIASGVGDSDLTADAATLTFEGTTGDLAIKVRNGTLRAHHLFGSLNATAENSDLSLVGISGNASVRSSYGDVRLGELAGRIQLTGLHASVSLSDIGGDLESDISGCTLELHRLNGAATIVAHGSTIKGDRLNGATRITGTTTAVNLLGVMAMVEVTTTERQTTIERAQGPVIVRSEDGAVEIRRSATRIEVELRGGPLRLHRNQGPVLARVTDGSVDLAEHAAVAIDISAERADVRLALGDDSAALDLVAEPGAIVTDGQGVRRSGPTARLERDGNPAALVRVRVRHGIIRLDD